MISEIDLRHFKCFEDMRLPLRNLTLLSGHNSSGKSAILQALALLHQTMREQESSTRLMLNGSTLCLGTSAEVIDHKYGNGSCQISLFDDKHDYFDWRFEGKRFEKSMKVQRCRGETRQNGAWNVSEPTTLKHLLPIAVSDHSLTRRLRQLSYLTAERLGPRDNYPFDDSQLESFVGPRGERAVSVLHSGGEQEVWPGLAEDDVPPTRMRQVESCITKFFPGCSLAIERPPRASALSLRVRMAEAANFQRPAHVGMGLTQVLPIIVAALFAIPDDILLLETPENHLHPSAQSVMGEFLGKVSSVGIQVIVETHSDHVLNGIRRTVKEGVLSPENVAIYFCRPRGAEQHYKEPQVSSLQIDANGNLDDWPRGFFDQVDIDSHYFAGWEHPASVAR